MSGARWLLALTLLAGLAGCRGPARSLDNDPLVGGSPIPRAPAGSLPTTPRGGDAVTRGDVPPVPPAETTSSPAALTNGAIAPSGDRRSAAAVTLGGPRTVEGRAARPDPPDTGTTVPTAATAAGAAGSYEQLQQQLQARGVVWQQLKMVGKDEWEFRCSIVPDPKQPWIQDSYQARAAGPFGVAAIRLVLEEIDQKRR
jgi:hypothetical protein